jgi:hypothetical protein
MPVTQLVDQAQAILHFDDPDLANYNGLWNTLEGGSITATSVKGELPSRAGTLSFGGKAQMQNITLRRYFFPDRDESASTLLYKACGSAQASVIRRSTDRFGNPITKGQKWSGTLIDVAMPGVDSDSQDKAMIQIIIETEGALAVAPPPA